VHSITILSLTKTNFHYLCLYITRTQARTRDTVETLQTQGVNKMEGPVGIPKEHTPAWKAILYIVAPGLFAALCIAIDRWV
jgi:hypothetical protein